MPNALIKTQHNTLLLYQESGTQGDNMNHFYFAVEEEKQESTGEGADERI